LKIVPTCDREGFFIHIYAQFYNLRLWKKFNLVQFADHPSPSGEQDFVNTLTIIHSLTEYQAKNINRRTVLPIEIVRYTAYPHANLTDGAFLMNLL